MRDNSRYVERRRREAWDLGVRLRETLVLNYMKERGLGERPFLKDIVDELIEDVQGARLRIEILPLDRFAQTEWVEGRPHVSINSRIGAIPGVKDAAGVAHVAKWHESVHVAESTGSGSENGRTLALPGFDNETPRLIVCRQRGLAAPGNMTEFTAENAGLAAAVSRADLLGSQAFLELSALASRGGDLGGHGFHLLYESAEDIGVNITGLVRYLQQRGYCQVVDAAGKKRLVANRRLFEDEEWL